MLKQIIKKIKDFFLIAVNRRLNKKYLEHPEILIAKLNKEKQEQIDKIKEDAVDVLDTKSQWESEITSLRSAIAQLNVSIKREKEDGNVDGAAALAETWQEQQRLLKYYEDSIGKLEDNYQNLIKSRRQCETAYDNKIAKVKTALASYKANRQIMKMNELLQSLNLGDGLSSPDIADITSSLEEENRRIQSQIQVAADFEVANATTTEGDKSALDAWEASQAENAQDK